MININGKSDEFYRYKMPPISGTISGRGNGIFTILNNLDDISKYINQPSIILLKYLSIYFGAMSNEEKMTITGGYNNDELQKALQTFINAFVICSMCNVPEIIPQIIGNKKTLNLELKCSACGKISNPKLKNKNEQKGEEIIIKYLQKNTWTIINKGTIISQNTIASKSVDINDLYFGDDNPF